MVSTHSQTHIVQWNKGEKKHTNTTTTTTTTTVSNEQHILSKRKRTVDEKKMKQIRHKHSNALGRIWIIEPELWKKKCVCACFFFISRASKCVRLWWDAARTISCLISKQRHWASATKIARALVAINLAAGVVVVVLLFILLRVKILFLIIYTHLYEYCISSFRFFLCRSINFYIGPFYCWMREKKEYDKNTPYTRWFYVDQPNRTNINFENMIIIHGYCIQTIHFLFPCLCFPLALSPSPSLFVFVVHSTSFIFYSIFFILFFLSLNATVI